MKEIGSRTVWTLDRYVQLSGGLYGVVERAVGKGTEVTYIKANVLRKVDG